MNAVSTQFVEAYGLNWYTEKAGAGNTVLLVHGTAASSHSWRQVMPLLVDQYQVVALDLPGHGQTVATASGQFSLEGMAAGVAAVMQAMKLNPEIVVGHSAGAAILAVACARRLLQPQNYVSFNGAFYPFGGIAGNLFSPVAKLLAFNFVVPHLFSGLATRATVEKLLRDTGSNLNSEGVDYYFNLLKQPKHVGAALKMMASWDLRGMDDVLARLSQTCIFVAGDRDMAVPPATADKAAARCQHAKSVHIKKLGHMLHEEDPALAAAIIRGNYP